jgi:hypothetical protein
MTVGALEVVTGFPIHPRILDDKNNLSGQQLDIAKMFIFSSRFWLF